MWPFKKKPVCNHSEILTDWLEDGENNALPDDEQRVYDAFMFLRSNADYWYDGNNDNYVSLANFEQCTELCLKNYSYTTEVFTSRKGSSVKPKLPKVVIQFMVSALLNDRKEQERKQLDAVWPLPTKWDKPKKQKKAK